MPPSEKPKSVLLVDDEDIFLEIGSLQLAAAGYEVATARGMKEGFERALELLPSLIISDVFMPPGPTGWELALALRENQHTRDIPVVMLTSMRDPWAEFASIGGDTEELRSRIGDVPVLSKVDDLGCLVKRITGLISGVSS